MDAKSKLTMLESMTSKQRQLFFQAEKLQMEEAWLKFLTNSMKETDAQVEFYTSKAKSAYWDYENLHDESALELAEQYVAVAQDTKDSRYKLSEVREQRERVQCQRKIVNQLTEKTLNETPIEPSPFLNLSES